MDTPASSVCKHQFLVSYYSFTVYTLLFLNIKNCNGSQFFTPTLSVFFHRIHLCSRWHCTLKPICNLIHKSAEFKWWLVDGKSLQKGCFMYTSVAARDEDDGDKSTRENRSYAVWPDYRMLEQQSTGVNQQPAVCPTRDYWYNQTQISDRCSKLYFLGQTNN